MTYDSQEALERRRNQLERELERVDSRIGMLANIPDEPAFEDGEPSVIWFRRQWNSARKALYTFAALRIGNGKWYVTGGQSPMFETWTELYQWINEYGEVEIWTATVWEPV